MTTTSTKAKKNGSTRSSTVHTLERQEKASDLSDDYKYSP